MCVYSLDASRTQKAKRGDKVVTHNFGHAVGFAPAGTTANTSKPMAVCMLPGAEIAFDHPPRYNQVVSKLVRKSITDTVATLVQVNGENHKDALKFPSIDEPVLLNDIAPGATARVLKLSVQDEPVHTSATSIPEGENGADAGAIGYAAVERELAGVETGG